MVWSFPVPHFAVVAPATNIFASNIYNLCKRADVLDADEKNIVISEISRLCDATADEYTKNLLVLSIKKLRQ